VTSPGLNKNRFYPFALKVQFPRTLGFTRCNGENFGEHAVSFLSRTTAPSSLRLLKKYMINHLVNAGVPGLLSLHIPSKIANGDLLFGFFFPGLAERAGKSTGLLFQTGLAKRDGSIY
jgi:hypothetical protein